MLQTSCNRQDPFVNLSFHFKICSVFSTLDCACCLKKCCRAIRRGRLKVSSNGSWGNCDKIFEYHGTVSGHLVLSETAALIVTPLSMRALTETALAFKYLYLDQLFCPQFCLFGSNCIISQLQSVSNLGENNEQQNGQNNQIV